MGIDSYEFTRLLLVCPPALLDDVSKLLKLTLRTEHRTKLTIKCQFRSIAQSTSSVTYPLLGQLSCLFILEGQSDLSQGNRVELIAPWSSSATPVLFSRTGQTQQPRELLNERTCFSLIGCPSAGLGGMSWEGEW